MQYYYACMHSCPLGGVLDELPLLYEEVVLHHPLLETDVLCVRKEDVRPPDAIQQLQRKTPEEEESLVYSLSFS